MLSMGTGKSASLPIGCKARFQSRCPSGRPSNSFPPSMDEEKAWVELVDRLVEDQWEKRCFQLNTHFVGRDFQAPDIFQCPAFLLH